MTGNQLIIMKYSYLFKFAKLFSNLCFQRRGVLSIFDCHKILENYGCYLYKRKDKVFNVSITIIQVTQSLRC